MRQIPKLPRYLSLLLLGVTFSFPLQIMFLFGHTAQEYLAIYYKLTNLNLLVMALAFVNSLLLLRMSPVLKYTIPLMVVAVLWNNYYVGISEINFSFEQSLLGSLALSTNCGLLFLNPYREIIQNPNKRWWLVPPRKLASLPIRAHPQMGIGFLANTFDISQNGAFICFPSQLSQNDRLLEYIKVGMILDLNMTLNHVHKLHLRAEVVRKSMANGRYPTGIGIRFKSLSKYDWNALNETIQRAGE